MISNQNIENFKAFVNNHFSFYIVGHEEPDGDCISSCLGLAELLNIMGKKTILVSAGPFKRVETKQYEHIFLPSVSDYSSSADSGCGIFVVDCSSQERIGSTGLILKDDTTFYIDHHKTAVNTGSNCIIDSSAPAAAYLIQLIFEAVHGEVTPKVASILFFGLTTDTGFFRFLESDSAPVFAAASRLIQKGANPKKTYNEMTGHKAFSTRKLLGILLERAEQYFDGRLIITYETYEETLQFGQNGRDSDALFQMLLSVEGVEAIVNIKQETPEQCTAGLRSRDNVDVSTVAACFGGGGHKNAAGLSTTITIKDFIPLVLKEFGKIFQ